MDFLNNEKKQIRLYLEKIYDILNKPTYIKSIEIIVDGRRIPSSIHRNNKLRLFFPSYNYIRYINKESIQFICRELGRPSPYIITSEWDSLIHNQNIPTISGIHLQQSPKQVNKIRVKTLSRSQNPHTSRIKITYDAKKIGRTKLYSKVCHKHKPRVTSSHTEKWHTSYEHKQRIINEILEKGDGTGVHED